MPEIQNQKGNGGVTTIRISAGADGNSYSMEIVEADAKNGKRIDQKVATWILQLDSRLREPDAMNMLQMAQQNPQGMMQQFFSRMMGGGNMMPPYAPPYGGNSFPRMY